MLPKFPFTFRKDYGISASRGITYTATQGNKPDMVNVSWSGNGVHLVALQYPAAEVERYLTNTNKHEFEASWTLVSGEYLIEQPKPHSFGGKTLIKQRDGVRLTGQYLRVSQCMNDGQWRSLSDISKTTGDPEASISARLRDLRKDKFGAQTVERRYISNGMFEYRLLAEDSRLVV